MSQRRRVGISAATVVLLVGVAAVSPSAAASEGTTSGGLEIPQVASDSPAPAADESTASDVAAYAERFAVPMEEAHRRLGLQEDIDKVREHAQEVSGPAWAGLRIEHSPSFRIVISVTSTDGLDVSAAIRETDLVADEIEIRQVEHSLDELLNEARKIREANLGLAMDTSINEALNVVEVFVTRNAEGYLPVVVDVDSEKASVIAVDQLATPSANIYAGLHLSSCTAGFTVRNSSWTKGITTAAHCTNTLSYSGTSLPYVSGSLAQTNDVQWHTTPGFTDKNWAYDGIWGGSTPYYRTITSTVSRGSQDVGDWVCKYGKTTGYDCGEIISRTYCPNWVGSCWDTFIRVDGGTKDLSSPGDSGGPVYYSSQAWGIHSGAVGSGSIHDMIYMAVNYVSNLGLTVLTS